VGAAVDRRSESKGQVNAKAPPRLLSTVPAEGDHRHCKVCGKVCGVSEDTCSRACREKRAAQIATRRNYSYLLYAAIAILLVAFLSSVIR